MKILRSVFCSDEIDENDDIQEVEQEYTSENTSINSTKLPAIYSMVNFPKGTVVLDYGGGKFDNAVAYLDSIGCKGYVYDPYNRSAEHNREVIKSIRANGGADITLCSNVLNVIKEPEVRQNVLENIKKLTKPSGKVYITVYEGKGDGAESPTKSGYQLNRKTVGYIDEVKEVFPEASRKGKLICASYQAKLKPINQACRVYPRSVKSSTDIDNLNDEVDTERWVQRNLKAEYDEYCYCGNGGRSWVTMDSDHIDTWPTKEEAIADGKQNYKRTFKYGRDWDVVKLEDIQSSASAVNSSTNYSNTNITASSDEGYVYTYCDECGKKNRVKVVFNNFNEPFNDTEFKCKYCGARNLLTDPHKFDDDGYVIESATNINTLTSEIKKAVQDTMTSDSFGFEPDEVDEYSVVEVTEEDNRIKAEVRAELDYDGLYELCEALNSVVEKYDRDAYFEPVEPGIADAYIEVNKRRQLVNSSASFINKYGEREHHDYISRGGRKFSVYYNEIDNSPEADPYKMLKDFKAQVSMIAPYDDADYVWANIKNGSIFIMKGNKAIDRSYYMNADDMDVENDEWCDAIIDQAIDNISEINDKIKPRIIHNSTEVTRSTVEASSYYGSDDVDETSDGFLSEDDTFICEGEEYVWIGPISDTLHLDSGNWCVQEAVKVDDATKQYENGTDADSWYFVVDTDTGLIDWGPCDTYQEAQEFLDSKVDDYNGDMRSL